jgi:hypothetical protein
MELIYLFIGVGIFAIGAGIWGYVSQHRSQRHKIA